MQSFGQHEQIYTSVEQGSICSAPQLLHFLLNEKEYKFIVKKQWTF